MFGGNARLCAKPIGGSIFLQLHLVNGQNVIPLHIILKALKHPQPPTPMETGNTVAHGFTHSNIKLKGAKAWDMKYHWLRDRETHKELDIYWREGKNNDSDYFTKHHPPDHHQKMRS